MSKARRSPRRSVVAESRSLSNTLRSALILMLAVLSTAALTTDPASARPRGMAPLGAKPTHDHADPASFGAGADPGLPARVDLRRWAVPVGDQGDINSCVSWVVAHDLMGWWANRTEQSVNDFAPMYNYSQLSQGVDEGTYPDVALALAAGQGNDTTEHYGGTGIDWERRPTDTERVNAKVWKLAGFVTLFQGDGQGEDGVTAVQNALSSGSPVALEFPVRPGFDALWDAPVGSTPPLDNDTTGTPRGYHEVLALGYDDQGVIVQNSWGTDFGSGGYARLSWNVVRKDVIQADIATGWGKYETPTISALGGLARTPSWETILASTEFYSGTVAKVTFEWGTTTAYGTKQERDYDGLKPSADSHVLGFDLHDLQPATLYHYRVTVETSDGKTKAVTDSGDRTFVTKSPPALTDMSASTISPTSELAQGDAQLFAATEGSATVEWGTTTAYGDSASQGMRSDGVTIDPTGFALRLDGLLPGTKYHYRVTIETPHGRVVSGDQTFTTDGTAPAPAPSPPKQDNSWDAFWRWLSSMWG